MSLARFRVYRRNFNGPHEATVIIDRGAGIFRVRPLRKWKTYELPLAYAAELVMWAVIRAEAREARALKKERAKLRIRRKGP